MNIKLIAIILFIALFAFLTYPKDRYQPKDNIVIVLDAGHGGLENGSISQSGIREKDINLAISQKVFNLLKDDFDVVLTRNSDIYISLEQRKNIAKINKADLLFSIHNNDFKENCSDLSGSEFHVNKEALNKLGYSIQEVLFENLLIPSRKLQKSQKFTIFNSQIPSMIFEVDFLCDRNSALLLNNTGTQEKIAEIISTGIKKYFKTPSFELPTKNILENYTIIAIYGRSFNIDPENKSGLRRSIARMGSLGFYSNFSNFYEEVLIEDIENKSKEINKEIPSIKDLLERFDSLNGDKGIIPAIDVVVYSPSCLENNSTFIWNPNNVNTLLRLYGNTSLTLSIIKPALDNGFLVFIDHQLGNQSVEQSMQEIIEDKYLDYPNVHIAFDPEWHVYPYENRCSGKNKKIGSIDAEDINKALISLNNYIIKENISREIIVIFHQFMEEKINDKVIMIRNKSQINNPNPNIIKIVFDADGIDPQCIKILRYNGINHPDYMKFAYSAIKYFPDFNPYRVSSNDRDDFSPIMNEAQLLGKEKSSIPCKENRLYIEPSIIIRN